VNRINHTPARRVAGSAAIALAAATLLGNGLPAQAQQTEVEALRAQIEELSQRLEKLETSQVAAAETARSTPPVSSRFPVTLSGLLQVHSLNFFNQEGPAPTASDTFRLRRGEIRITAPSITPRLSGTIMFDPAKAQFNRSASFGEAGSNTIRARDAILQEIQLSYLLKRAAPGAAPGMQNNIYIDVGQFKIPVGYESLLSSSALPLVERALMFTQRDPFDGGYGDVRDTGIQLRGTQGQFEYRLGVFNGFGDRQNTLAVSDAKAVLGLLSYRPKGIQGLQLGVSGGTGNTGFRGSGSLLSGPRADRDIVNAFAVYNRDKLTLQAEYLEGSGTGITNVGSSGPVISARDIRGYYGTVGYRFTPKLEGVLRYDFLNANRDGAGDTEVRDIIAGLNYYIRGNNAKIQVNVLRRDGAGGLGSSVSNPSSDIQNDRTELRVQGQVAF
jgi:hypothetical protein